jgi:hypothetical protein
MGWLPTPAAASGILHGKKRLLEDYTIGNWIYKARLDACDVTAYPAGASKKSPRESFFTSWTTATRRRCSSAPTAP